MAVISALLVVAAVTMIVASLLQRQDAFLRAVQAAQTRAQAQAVLEAGLALARGLLREDGRRQAATRADGDWAAPILDTRLQQPGRDTAFVGRLEDEQGKFNLRNLVFEGRLYQDSVDELLRLCALVGVTPETGLAIARRMLDSQAGAFPLPPPRRLDELAGVPGVDAAVLARLRRHVTVLPRVTLVNVNTASAEVIAARVPGLSLEQAKAMVAQRDAGLWFVNNGDFANRLASAHGAPGVEGQGNRGGDTAAPPAPEAPRVAVASGWFTLTGAARLGGTVLPLQALLARTSDGASRIVWWREGA